MDNDINEPYINYKDEEANNEDNYEILQNIRGGFISKVYGIIAFQIFLTSIVIFFAFTSSSFKKY